MSVRTDVTLAIERQLAVLGMLGPDVIASQLAADGIRGRCGSAAWCPVAVLLELAASAVGYGVADVWVDPQVASVAIDLCHMSFTLPGSVVAFIDSFDTGGYPELVQA